MDLRVASIAPVWHSRAHRSALRLGLIAVALLALLFFLTGCGKASQPAAVDSTVSSSPAGASGLPKLIVGVADRCSCGQIAKIGPRALAEAYVGAVEVVMVDIYEDEAQAQQLGIDLAYTYIFIDPEGNEIYRHEDYLTMEKILALFQQLGYPLTRTVTSPGQETESGGG